MRKALKSLRHAAHGQINSFKLLGVVLAVLLLCALSAHP